MPTAPDPTAVADAAVRTALDATPTTPDTIVLIHGLWLTPLSWESWEARYEERGFRVVVPRWPGEAESVEAVRADPSGMAGVGIVEIVDHLAAVVEALPTPPILIGHSFGGLFVQLLLDRGLGAVGVGISPAATKGVLGLPPAQLRAAFPVLGNPLNRGRTKGLTLEQFHWGFANALDEDAARVAYERLHVPGPARPLFQAALGNLVPRAANRVDLRNPDRAPLLLVSNELDRTVPASVVREQLKRWRRSPAVTELRHYDGRSHFTAGEPGWEQVADDVLEWALAHA
jgi:alpha-beta hydrolase superfamily lysophospholipase